jgi:hypothetical protein
MDLDEVLGRKRDWGALHTQIGRLLEVAPEVDNFTDLREPAVMQWFGRARALSVAAGVSSIAFDTAVGKFPYSSWKVGVQEAFQLVYQALAECELKAPPSAAGSFIPVGTPFDAFAALAKVLQSAKSDVLIVDPYLDETALTEFGTTVPEGVALRLLGDQATCKPSLAPAAAKWASQYAARRPLQVRLAPARALHDRVIFVDGTGAWTLTQSLKDFAKRSPAEIVRADDTAALKIAAYESIWATSNIML